MHSRQHIDLFIFLVQEIFQLPYFQFQRSNSILQRLGITSWKRSPAKFIGRLALKGDVLALRARGRQSITSYFLTPASVTGLGDTHLIVDSSDLDHLHGQYARHREVRSAVEAALGLLIINRP